MYSDEDDDGDNDDRSIVMMLFFCGSKRADTLPVTVQVENIQ